LLFDFAHEMQRTSDFTIVGPPGIEGQVEAITSPCFPKLLSKRIGYDLVYQEALDASEGRVGDVAYVAREVVHVPDFPCFGFRVEVDGRKIAYSGDSTLCEALVKLGEGADAFVLECSLWEEGAVGPHMRPDDIRELRRRLGPNPHFVLTHLGPGARDPGIENTVLASDFERLTF
jgi:hypothetical protein